MIMAPRRSRSPRRWGTIIGAAAVLVACGNGGTGPGGQEQGAESLEGKRISLIVPYDTGGGFDTYARGLAPYIGEELNADVVVRNQPGAGGLIGAKRVFSGKKDGTNIGLINYPGAVFAEQTGQEGVDFDNSQWTFLGRVAAVNPLVYASPGSGLKTAEDLITSSQKVKFGIGGVGSDAFYASRALSEAFDFPIKIIAGYEGGAEADAALLANEVDVSVNAIDSGMTRAVGNGAAPLIYVGSERSELAPDVPTVVEVAQNDDQRAAMEALASIYDLERVLVGPPGMDEQVVAQLRDAISNAMENPKFLEEMKKAERSVNALGGEEAQERAEQVQAGIDKVKPLLQ